MREEYFDFLYSLVMGKDENYIVLCEFLDNVEFVVMQPMDNNRYEDGISMRYRFAYEKSIPMPAVAGELDDKPCSVFEMMVALALRMEEDVMCSTKYEDRTGVWFHDMLISLTLDDMTNRKFDAERAEKVINAFLLRKYQQNGRGGLFTINDRPDQDMRKVEIWYQAMWYLNNVMKGEER